MPACVFVVCTEFYARSSNFFIAVEVTRILLLAGLLHASRKHEMMRKKKSLGAVTSSSQVIEKSSGRSLHFSSFRNVFVFIFFTEIKKRSRVWGKWIRI